jgi:DNA-binding transcriptional regulator LsrR (DeoR family)
MLADIGQLQNMGAVGDMLGTFLDDDGTPLPHTLNRRVMALTPEALRVVPISVLASGGMNKAPVVRAILRAH